jgi:hypothetical protein
MAKPDSSTRQDFGHQGISTRSAAGIHGWLSRDEKSDSDCKSCSINRFRQYAPVAQLDRAPDFESLLALPEPLGNSHNPRNHWGIQRQSLSPNAADDARSLAQMLALPFCTELPIASLESRQEHAPVPAIPWVTSSFTSGVRRMSLVRLAVVCLALLVSASTSFAQGSYPPPAPGAGDPPCVPYNGLNQPVCPPSGQPPCSLSDRWCVFFPHTSLTSVQEYGDFPNVFFNVQGLEWAFVSLKNKSNVASVVVVEVTIAGRAPFYRDYPLGPQDRTDVQLNTWEELAGHQGGVAVLVRADQATSVSVAMHPQITDASNPAQIKAFWQQAKFLEGR